MTKKEKQFPDLSWQRYLLPPIHPEGVKIFAVIVVVSILLGLFCGWLWLIFGPLCLFSYYFFRNPERIVPQGDNLIISPADGIVCKIEEVDTPKAFKMVDEKLTRISIFMSVFNVHVNRSPAEGRIINAVYVPGKFLNATLDKASKDNERQLLAMKTKSGKEICFVQIAGLVARRIVCNAQIGQDYKAGERFGMIRFGSRLDVYLPEGVEPQVVLGQTMVAGETIIANMNSDAKAMNGVIR